MSNSQQLPKPQEVGTAVKFLYATVGIGVMRSIMESSRHAEATSRGFVVAMTFSVFVFMCFIIFMIGKGKDWARIAFLVLFIVGVPMSIFPMIQSLTLDPMSGLLGLVQVVMQLIAIVLLFQGDSSAWFKAEQWKTEHAQQRNDRPRK